MTQGEDLSDQSTQDIESPQVKEATNEETISSAPRSIGGAHRRPGHKTTTESTTRKKKVKKIRKSSPTKLDFNYMMKYFSLFLLIAQMVGLVLMLRISRTAQKDDLYLASTAVFLMEVSFYHETILNTTPLTNVTKVMKFIICLSVIFIQSKYNTTQFLSELSTNIYHAPYEILKLSVPSLLYCIQNNLLYLALTNLDAATYQVCYQLKILTTAMFSAVMLQRKFNNFKWLSLVCMY